MQTLFRVGIYLRLSNEDKNKLNKLENSESIKNQRNLLLEEINKRENFILVDEYCDEDLSGAGTYRPEFERLIRDCELGKIDIVLCKSQSRFSRDMEIIEKYLHNKFLEWNVRFIGISDHADTLNLGNKKARQINGLVNEWYLEDVSNNIRSAFYTKMKHGEFISPFAPYGYDVSSVNHNQLIIDSESAVIVQKIFHLYLKGLGFLAIARKLNEQCIPSPSYYKYLKGCKLHINSSLPREKIKWNQSAIKNILTNEVYIGHLIQGKRTTISYKNHRTKKKSPQDWIRSLHTHEPIISDVSFYKVQALLKKKVKPLKKTGIVHLFAGKIYCLECGKMMRKKDSTHHEYLVCSGYIEKECSNHKGIRYDLLKQIVFEKINYYIKQYSDDALYQDNHDISTKSDNTLIYYQKLISSYENKLIEFKNIFKNLYEDKVKHTITEEQFHELNLEYLQQKKLYDNKIKILKKKVQNDTNQSIHYNSDTLFQSFPKIVIDELIDSIFIGTVDELKQRRIIQIRWNF